MKSFLSFALSWLLLAFAASAYTLTGGSVSLNKQKVLDISATEAPVQHISVGTVKDVLSIKLELEAAAQPHQLMLIVSNGAGLEQALFPVYRNGKVTSDIYVHKLPEVLLAQDKLTVTLVAASAEEDNLVKTLFEVVPSAELKEQVTYEAPQRLGALPEIHHIFREDTPTVNAVIPVAFSAVAVALLVALIGAWAWNLQELFAAREGAQWKTGLVTVLGYFEYTFVKYYLGSSIFTTIFHVFVVVGPLLFFSSRALTTLARQRASGKA